MFLDVVDSGVVLSIYLLVPIIIILLFFTVSRFAAYKENPNRKTKIQFIVLLVALLIASVWLAFDMLYQPNPPRIQNQWNNISTYHGDQSNDID